ncbi:MAG: FAD:protein FMN transferase [Lewinellaceae bacterium]|nr:FAD:protein FMN transferase [Saprospiraceae bacterium]MCB9330131.1 FAD:protein FMN transferase [Lewinellaceae bacterium]
MLHEYRRQARLMGSAFEFIIGTDLENAAAQALLDDCIGEVQRIEQLLTEFSPESITGQLNQNAGHRALAVPKEVYDLLQRCAAIAELTRGAFDISAGALKKCYSFSNGPGTFPPASTIEQALQKTGYEKIQLLRGQQVFLKMPDMHIGFGGIGKGYAADCVRALLRSKGVESGVIDASGDLSAWGLRPDGQAWKIGIAHPDKPEVIMLWLPVVGGLCLATSGNYEQFFEYKGIRYGHTIDPRTGQPVQGIKSVTVVSPSAELSDALATAVTVLGVKEGIGLLDQVPDTHGIIVDANQQIFQTKNLNIHVDAPA